MHVLAVISLSAALVASLIALNVCARVCIDAYRDREWGLVAFFGFNAMVSLTTGCFAVHGLAGAT